MLEHISTNALIVISKRNKKAFPLESPLVEMSMDAAEAIVKNYNDRREDGYVVMTPMEFQAHIMVQDRLTNTTGVGMGNS